MKIPESLADGCGVALVILAILLGMGGCGCLLRYGDTLQTKADAELIRAKAGK